MQAQTLTCDGVVMCVDCPLRNTPDCTEYQAELTDIGRGDDYRPNFWDALPTIERILGETQNRRGSNPHYAVNVLDAGPLCYIGQ